MNAVPVGHGSYMSMEVVKAAIGYDDNVFLGGGEPTLHPQFGDILAECIAKSDMAGCITNGTNRGWSLILAALGSNKGNEHFYSALSQDEFHDVDMVDDDVVEAFEKYADIRSVTRISPVGRAADLEYGLPDGMSISSGCCCDEWVIDPNGDIRPCGCPDAPIMGNILGDDSWGDASCLREERPECQREKQHAKV